MTFTSTLPTQPGFYAWKPSNEPGTDRILIGHVRQIAGRLLFLAHGFSRVYVEALGGLWCRLVPAEEINLTAMEFWMLGQRNTPQADAWNNSRAKRVADGKE